MAANQPIPINTYSKTETDLKLENLEQRLDAKLEKLNSDMNKNFDLILQELHWMKNIIFFVVFPFCFVMLGSVVAIFALLFNMMTTLKHF